MSAQISAVTLGMGNRNKMWFDRYLSHLTGRLWKWENDLMAQDTGNGEVKDDLMFPSWVSWYLLVPGSNVTIT